LAILLVARDRGVYLPATRVVPVVAALAPEAQVFIAVVVELPVDVGDRTNDPHDPADDATLAHGGVTGLWPFEMQQLFADRQGVMPLSISATPAERVVPNAAFLAAIVGPRADALADL